MELIETLRKAGIIPVIVIEDAEQAVPLARALVKGGLPVLEVTFRTAAAADAIARIKAAVPEAVVGAGTLLTPAMVKAAKAAGAVFGVAPGFDPAVLAALGLGDDRASSAIGVVEMTANSSTSLSPVTTCPWYRMANVPCADSAAVPSVLNTWLIRVSIARGPTACHRAGALQNGSAMLARR